VATDTELAAMRHALALARTPDLPLGPNPRVGAVIVDASGATVGEGFHLGAGTPHAEVVALRQAGAAARGGTVVVTLEPCNHIGRTGPCTQALIDAGVRRVVFAQHDLNPAADGGTEAMRAAGVEVEDGVLAEEAEAINETWTFSVRQQRPFVTWKFAATLDGRSAAADGSARWITGPEARADVHRLRASCDTVLVGTGTVEADNPRLTARDEHDRPKPPDRQPLRVVMGHRELDPDSRVFDGSARTVVLPTHDPRLTARDEHDRPKPPDRQPLRVVMGHRELDPDSRVFDGSARTVVLPTHDPRLALAALYAVERQHVFLEGGPTLAAAFLSAGLVDEVIAYVAPALLGSGSHAIGDLGIRSMEQIRRFRLVEATPFGDDVRLTLRPRTPARAHLSIVEES
jgi:diaminohydroxyphosphoribosylaminopyrimidine deaminase / 5-amino-6-(5-phosphoribosylamino)uracil reductase